MPNTSDFIRKVLRESFSDKTPCEMCNNKSTNNNNNEVVPNENHVDDDPPVNMNRSLTQSPTSVIAPEIPFMSARECYMIRKVKSIIPKLSKNMTKGVCGRIAIIGGSTLYTGATYFAAISALKCGADLVHIFCEKELGPIIRTYSPDLFYSS